MDWSNAKQVKKWKADKYKETRELRLQRVKARQAEMKVWFGELKRGLKCSRCPEDHPGTLDFHHRDPDTKRFNIAHFSRDGYGKQAILDEISKCDVLCANCHRKLHYDENNCGLLSDEQKALLASMPVIVEATAICKDCGSGDLVPNRCFCRTCFNEKQRITMQNRRDAKNSGD